MPQVKVRRRGISAEDAAAVIRGRLGQGLQITQNGDRELELKKNYFVRAKVSISDEPGGTVFDVRGQGMPIPLLMVTTLLVKNRGIARQVAEAIGEPGPAGGVRARDQPRRQVRRRSRAGRAGLGRGGADHRRTPVLLGAPGLSGAAPGLSGPRQG
jgi:hypothetical protein